MIKDVILNARSNSTSKIENSADFLLSPARILFGGKKFIHLQGQSYILKDDRKLWINISIKIVSIVGLLLLPIGLLIKSVIFLKKESWQVYAVPLKEISEDNISKELYFEIVKDPSKFLKYSSKGPLGQAEYNLEALNQRICRNNIND